MIDFRYHLVSLISVFLALSVGIALGAGPLKESIGDTLTGQVDQLRTDKAELRRDVDVLSTQLASTDAALTELTPSVLDGVLGERRVAVVALDDVSQESIDEVSTTISQAGGAVTAVATVTAAWTDPAREAFRQSLAETLVTYLDPVPDDASGTSMELAAALVQALTTADPAAPDTLSDNAQVILELLTGDAGLVTVADTVTAPADAIVILSGLKPAEDDTTHDVSSATVTAPAAADDTATASATAEATAEPAAEATAEATAAATAEASETSDSQLADAVIEAWTDIAVAAQDLSDGAVVAGYGSIGVVHAVRSDSELSSQISTVDDIATPAGRLAVPLALVNRLAGTVGQFGTEPDATAVIPARVELPTIERPVAIEPPASEPPQAPEDDS
jgi:hypothetical protein